MDVRLATRSVPAQETARCARRSTVCRGSRLPLTLALGALLAVATCGLSALTLGGCAKSAAAQGSATVSPSERPITWFTAAPLGEHQLTTHEKRMLAAAADFVNDPEYQGYRTDRNDYRKYVGQPGAIVAYVVVLMQAGIDVSAVVDTASGEVRPIATISGGVRRSLLWCAAVDSRHDSVEIVWGPQQG